MPKKKNAKLKTKNRLAYWVKNISKKADSTFGRLTTLTAMVIIVGGGYIVIHHLNPDPYSGAQKAADSFFAALADCNADSASKYYLPLQDSSSSTTQQFLKNCKPGNLAFNEDHRQSADTTVKNGVISKNAAYIYSYTENITGEPPSGQLLVYMVWSSKLGHWYIFSLTPTSLYNSSQP